MEDKVTHLRSELGREGCDNVVEFASELCLHLGEPHVRAKLHVDHRDSDRSRRCGSFRFASVHRRRTWLPWRETIATLWTRRGL